MLNVGIGLTSHCNCNCKHCYSRIYGNDAIIEKEKLIAFFEKFDVSSVNFGTGESFFYPDFIEIVRFLLLQGAKVSVTTNGYTVANLSDEELCLLHDVDFSLDYPFENLHDHSRQKGCFDMVMSGVQRCQKLGITCSIAWCLTPDNSIYIKDMLTLCYNLGVFLRVNIYKPVEGKSGFSYELFWKSINELFLWGDIISISEGIINAAIENTQGLRGCNSNNLRIFPDGTMSSCVYVPNTLMTIDQAITMSETELMKQFEVQYEHKIDDLCKKCDKFSLCNAGCMARRRISNKERDEFCFVDRKESPSFERIVFSKSATSEMFVHSDYICTIILDPRKDN